MSWPDAVSRLGNEPGGASICEGNDLTVPVGNSTEGLVNTATRLRRSVAFSADCGDVSASREAFDVVIEGAVTHALSLGLCGWTRRGGDPLGPEAACSRNCPAGDDIVSIKDG